MYKAEIVLHTEELEINPETGNYEGCNPDTFQDHGVVQKFTGTLEEIAKEVHQSLVSINVWNYDEENECLTFVTDGEYDYKVPKNERVPFLETYSLYLSKVEVTALNPTVLQRLT